MSYFVCESPRCTPISTRAVDLLIESRLRDLGGFSVRRVLPAERRKLIGPFIFFDHFGPVTFGPGEGIDVRPHPHIGIATVTYLFEGEILHRDSLGHVQTIQPGAVNWMTAGRGIAHSERTAPEQRVRGARLHGIQSWVALAVDQEETDPAFVHHAAPTLPRIERPGVELRIIAGVAYGATSPVATSSRMFYVDARLEAGATSELPQDYTQRAVYVVDGAITIGEERITAGSMAVLTTNTMQPLRALQKSRLMLLGGEDVGERHIWWNFVSSTRKRIDRAKRDWQAGRFAQVPGETELIPLPED